MFGIISFIVFICIIGILVYKDRKNIKKISNFVLIRKTKMGRRFIDKIARHKKILKPLSTIAVIVSVIGMISISFLLTNNAIEIIRGRAKEGARFIVPGPFSDAKTAPGLLIVPWWFWFIGIASIMIPHELFHGIISRLEKIRVKSFGWLLLIIIPGAFCEPDEKQLRRSKPSTKLRIYAAGSFANLLVAGSAILLITLITYILYQPAGLVFYGLIEGYPAHNANLTGAIKSINGIPVRSPENISMILSKIAPGTEIRIETTTGNFTLTTTKRPDSTPGSFIGISGPYNTYNEMKPKLKFIESQIDFLLSLLTWIFILNLGVGLINLLPIKPLDGGLIFEIFAQRFKRRADLLLNILSLAMAGVLLFNIFGPVILQILQ